MTPSTPRGGRTPVQRILVRRVGSGLTAALLVVGTLAGASASALPPPGDDPGTDAWALAVGAPPSAEAASSIGQVRETNHLTLTTLDQVFELLARAESMASAADEEITPAVRQASAELGMLLTTYIAQEDVAVDDDQRAVVDDAVAEAAAETAADDGPVAFDRGPVTMDDIVTSAVRLAELLDSAAAYPVSVTVTATGADGATPQTDLLREAVERYGTSTSGYANGQIPAEVLCPLPFAPGHRLRCDAAAQLVALNAAFEARFGRSIPMTDSYRPLATQISLRARKPHLAAVPGTSLHGWGIAVDLGAPISTGTSAEYLWLRLHGPDYGWDNPSWARLGGSKPEPWHFEFFAAGPVPNRALSEQDVARFRADAGAGTAGKGATGTGSAGNGATAQPAAQPTPTPSVSPDPSPSPSPSPSASPSPPSAPSAAPSPTPTASPEPSPDPPSPEPSASPEPTDPSPGPTDPSPEPSDPPSPDPSPSLEPSDPPSPDPSPSPEPSDPPSPEPTPSSDPAARPQDEQDALGAAPGTEPDPGPVPGASQEPADAGPSPTTY